MTQDVHFERLKTLVKSLLVNAGSCSWTNQAERIEAIKQILPSVDIDRPLTKGRTLLHLAATKFISINEDIEKKSFIKKIVPLDIEYLITNYHPNPFVKDDKGFTPAMSASQHNSSKKEWRLLLAYEQSYQAQELSKAINAFAILNQLVEYELGEETEISKHHPLSVRACRPLSVQSTAVQQAIQTITKTATRLNGAHQNTHE